MIKYRTRFDKIEAIEIERETAHKVVLKDKQYNGKPQKENKVSDWCSWHDSWEQAHAFLAYGAEQKVMNARHALSLAEKQLERIKQIKQPS